MKRYLIERDIPGVDKLTSEQVAATAKAGTAAVEALAGDVQWEQSYVIKDKTFCVFRATDEQAVREHAKLAGFPVSNISEVNSIIGPVGSSS
ncbi:hypothetical protein J2X20_005894 [Pelomonas saccharophila]|uniref:DUF4242 domain-containing protein n=1 Tax=Roseateles saccharophilus TaxID=304 RepID=A0ABU1YWE9_ROSSA|nr:DUF4242 domain-containing protein [Roseateles saccharophilus]MDR7273204.1 hypothetical protein [Roseateles saccharophilus]